jgi:hypothetical protein
MRVIQLSLKGCSTCAMMSRILGDRVEHQMIADRPDLVALANATSSPIFVVMNGETFIDSFSGSMPLSVWERKVSECQKGET